MTAGSGRAAATDHPFHPGEIAVQERAGVRALWAGRDIRMIRPAMPDQHREFFERLPTLLVGGLDAGDWPWATVLVGAPGFLQSPDPRHLVVGAKTGPDDPLALRLGVGQPVGLLGLEPATRRRNRLNGTVVAVRDEGIVVEVDQSFGNCPRYIQAREPSPRTGSPWAGARSPVALGSRLDAAARALIESADTMFIASASARPRASGAADGLDVSHRGGRPGFIEIREDDNGTELILPDYDGNRLFNTFGNLLANPRAGLLFIDYRHGDLLQLSATARIEAEQVATDGAPGVQRQARLQIRSGWFRPGALGLQWSAPRYARELALG